MTAPGFRKVREDEVYDGYVIQVAHGYFEGPNGEDFQRDVVHHPGAVTVVPIDGDEVVLVRQYRAALDALLLELPAGRRDVDGEPPEVTAARELEEEVGLVPGRLEHLSTFHNSPGFCDELVIIYLATDLTAGVESREGVEEHAMTIERFPLTAVRSMIESGEIIDAKTIIGLLLALDRLA